MITDKTKIVFLSKNTILILNVYNHFPEYNKHLLFSYLQGLYQSGLMQVNIVSNSFGCTY